MPQDPRTTQRVKEVYLSATGKPFPSLERYTPAHYPLVKSWFKERGLEAPKKDELPDTGWIADGRVAGWLYLTNGNLALIEGIIADPQTVPSLRRESVRKLFGFLTDVAVSLGYTKVGGISKHPTMGKVAKDFGYDENDFKVYMLDTD